MNFYKRYTGDYARDTVHLSMVEDGAYNRLMDFYYSTEKPLPPDRKAVYRIARATDKAEQKAVDSVLTQFFLDTADGYRHKRIDVEIEKAKPKADANRENGKKGGRPRKIQPTGNPPENPLGFHDETHIEPNGEPALVNHSHSQKNNTYPSGVGASHGVGPVDNSAPPPLSADAVGELLVQLEAEKGRALRLSSRAHEALLRIADRCIGVPALLRAHALACARRDADRDTSPVNPGFLEMFLDEAMAEQKGGTPSATDWDATAEGVQGKAEELGVQRDPDEHAIWFRLRVIAASGDQRLMEREVSKAERMNPGEFDRVYRLMYGVAPGQVVA